MKSRAELFRYVELDVTSDTLTATYELDDRTFVETVAFEGVKSLETPAVVALAQLWYLIAGLSYYKAGAARRIDVGTTPLGTQGRRLLKAALSDGLGEFAYRNQLPLSDVTIEGRTGVEPYEPFLDSNRVLTPFGGGIDSVVTVEQLRPHVDQALFVVSPSAGRFAPLEATAAVTGLDDHSRVSDARSPDRAGRRLLLQRSRAGHDDDHALGRGGGRGIGPRRRRTEQ